MPSISSIAKRGISPGEARILKPILERMTDWRVSGAQKARFTVDTHVDASSRAAIQRAWNIVSEQEPETRRAVFRHLLLRGYQKSIKGK